MVSSTDLSTAPATWPVWLGNEDIVGAAPENMLSEVPGGGDSKRFFAVVANGLDDPAADPDHDGFTACQSYALGIDLAAPGILPGALPVATRCGWSTMAKRIHFPDRHLGPDGPLPEAVEPA